jgi:hypothetical protein
MTANPKRTKSRQPPNDLADYSKWLVVQNSEWSAPSTLEAALRKIEKEPSIWLSQAVEVMAFGDDAAAADPMELAARRCQASRALCEAARRDDVKLIGAPNQPGDSSNPIPRPYFDVPRQLGNVDNSLETNLDAISTDDFMVATSGGHQKWFSVRAESDSLILWLRGFVPGREKEWPVEAYMIEPMTKLGRAGYVPLSSALLWIMTDGGVARRLLEDHEAWDQAADRLLALISSGQVEVVGRPIGGGTADVIAGSTFAGIAMGRPLSGVSDILVGDDPWVMSTVYVDEEHWRGGFNDQLFSQKGAPASWTHLQVKKEDVLRSTPVGMKGFDDLGPKEKLTVKFLQDNYTDKNFGPVNALKKRITDKYPELKPLDDKTLKSARNFFEAELESRHSR